MGATRANSQQKGWGVPAKLRFHFDSPWQRKKQEENTIGTSLVATMRDPFSRFYYNLVTIR
jgi:hypothetical protein